MKIEKLNENQIKCTLTREDLASRQLKVTELAYGSEKAKQLFRDMMQQAFRDFHFEAENSPLMIEAIPLSPDSLVIIVTKVPDPEELDSRFARFSPEDGPGASAESLSGIDDVMSLISRLTKAAKSAVDASSAVKNQKAGSGAKVPALPGTEQEHSETDEAPDSSREIYRLSRFYLFHDLETLIRASQAAASDYAGHNSLYKNPDDGHLYLILQKGDTKAETFNCLCNILSEYGLQADFTTGLEELFREHMQVLLSGNALQTLRTL